MSLSNILYMESHRGRRDTRYNRALALSGTGAAGARVLEYILQAVRAADADRGAVLWMDDYGPAMAHPHALLDLAFDRPRRSFNIQPLQEAWQRGLPGFVDWTDTGRAARRDLEGVRSLCVVTLGTDGVRSWFLVVDSLTPRRPLNETATGELMFVAGELASAVLQVPGVGARALRRTDRAGMALSEGTADAFAGWPVLKDLEERNKDDPAARRIGTRFLVARVIRSLVEDELAADQESLLHQVRGVRDEMAWLEEEDLEGTLWERVLGAVERSDHPRLLAALLEWGKTVEGSGHVHGALEIYELSYELARATGSLLEGTDAARFIGRVYRTQADWERSLAWYELAQRVAEESGETRKVAVVLDGMANAYRDRGNLPRARGILHEVLSRGEDAGDGYAVAIAHHDLMTVEKLMGDLDRAIHHGWTAVQRYDTRDGSLAALFDLAGVLRERGELSAARDAYSVVSHEAEGFEHLILSLDAQAYIAALLQDESEHERIRTEMDALGWEKVSPVYRPQVFYFRGLSCQALGLDDEAKQWLEKALSFAESHGISKLVFDSEAALQAQKSDRLSGEGRAESDLEPADGILAVRQGLREMREALAVGSER